jgi:diketogulonate reductase-like aldo/keto reductase
MAAPGEATHFPARIGLGTWEMGNGAAQRDRDIAAVSHALEVGYRVLDTAEMYADGGAERIIGSALRAFGAARRAQLYIVSKVLPGNASRSGTVRLPGPVPVALARPASLRRDPAWLRRS